MTVLITLLIIAVLILVHEWGHFITARRIGIPVYEFSLGFGTKLLSVTRNGVQYSLRLVPLGGFVRMAGEEPGDMSDPDGYSNRTPFEKIRVAFSGPFMNFVLAVIIFIYSFAFIGIPNAVDEPILGKILKGKPAQHAGLQEGDRIISIDGKSISTWNEFTDTVSSSKPDTQLKMEVKRGDKTIAVNVTPETNKSTGASVIGVINRVTYNKLGIWEALKVGIQQTYELTRLMLSWLLLLITGGASTADLAGPVGITKLVGEAAQIGIVYLLNFAAYLSINLGIINLLPIPALDGSRIVFAAVEGIRRKRLEPEKEGLIHWLGFIFLMILIVFVTYNDIVRYIKG